MRLEWKNGPVSAASISGGVLKVRFPKPFGKPIPFTSTFGEASPWAPKAPVRNGQIAHETDSEVRIGPDDAGVEVAVPAGEIEIGTRVEVAAITATARRVAERLASGLRARVEQANDRQVQLIQAAHAQLILGREIRLLRGGQSKISPRYARQSRRVLEPVQIFQNCRVLQQVAGF